MGHHIIDKVKLTVGGTCPRCLQPEDKCKGLAYDMHYNEWRECDMTPEYFQLFCDIIHTKTLWSPTIHRTIRPNEQRLIRTFLLCTHRYEPRLPWEMRQLILDHVLVHKTR